MNESILKEKETELYCLYKKYLPKKSNTMNLSKDKELSSEERSSKENTMNLSEDLSSTYFDYMVINSSDILFDKDNILDRTSISVFSNLLTYCILLFLDDGTSYYLYHHNINQLTLLFPSLNNIEEQIIPGERSSKENTEFIIEGFNLYEFIVKIISIKKNISTIIQYYKPLTISDFEYVKGLMLSYKKDLAKIILVLAKKYKQLFCDNYFSLDRISYLSLIDGLDYSQTQDNQHIIKYLSDGIISREICLYLHNSDEYWTGSNINKLISLVIIINIGRVLVLLN
jgi:hypothetical protein